MICKEMLYMHSVKWSDGSISNNSIYHKPFTFTGKMSNSSIWPIDRTISGANTLGQSG